MNRLIKQKSKLICLRCFNNSVVSRLNWFVFHGPFKPGNRFQRNRSKVPAFGQETLYARSLTYWSISKQTCFEIKSFVKTILNVCKFWTKPFKEQTVPAFYPSKQEKNIFKTITLASFRSTFSCAGKKVLSDKHS